MNNAMKHGIHAVIILVILGLGSLLFPQIYHFESFGALILTTIVYFGIYYVFNAGVAYVIARTPDFESSTIGFYLFLLADIVPGALALYLMATCYNGLWMAEPWLISIILSAACEVLYMLGAFIQEQ